MLPVVFRYALIATLCSAQPAAATGGAHSHASPGSTTLTERTTKKVIYILGRGIEKCVRLPSIYHHDCYQVTYGKAAEVLNGNPAYAEAYAALIGVQDALGQMVDKNADPGEKPIRRGFKTYRAIQEAAIPQAKARAERALQEAETILLRAPENKQAHYSLIADAVNSNKVLLRSALLGQSLLRFALYLMQLRSA